MDPITIFVVAVLLASYITAAPDPVTASIRGGVGGAIGSAARSAGQEIRSDWTRSHAARSKRLQKKRDDRIKAWGNRDAKGNLIDPYGPTKQWLEKHLGRGGTCATGARSLGQSAGRAWSAAKTSARSGWQSGRAGAQVGPPAPMRRLIQNRSARREAAADPTSAPPGNPQAPPAVSGGNKEAPMAQQKLLELTNTDVLKAEVKVMEGSCTMASLDLLELSKYAESLTERYSTADFGTKPIGVAVKAIADTQKGIDDGRRSVIAFSEGLAMLRKALAESDQLAEVVAQQSATGKTEAFQSA